MFMQNTDSKKGSKISQIISVYDVHSHWKTTLIPADINTYCIYYIFSIRSRLISSKIKTFQSHLLGYTFTYFILFLLVVYFLEFLFVFLEY